MKATKKFKLGFLKDQNTTRNMMLHNIMPT